jgi:flagellar FliL protein
MSDETTEKKEGAPPPAKNKKSSIILLILIPIILGVVGVGLLMFSPLKNLVIHEENGKKEKKEKKKEEDEKKPSVFVNIPEVIVNLKIARSRGYLLKANFIVQVDSEAEKNKIEALKPMILDQIQVYLRSLQVEELQGSEGLERVRQELLSRINTILLPDKAINILFKTFLIQ